MAALYHRTWITRDTFDMGQRGRAREVSAVDLFCGLGGLTHGLMKAGIKVRLGVDIDPACEYPFVENNEGAEFLNRSVAKVTPATLYEASRTRETRP